VDLGIRALIDEAYGRAKALLESRRADLDAGARLLLEKNPDARRVSRAPAAKTAPASVRVTVSSS
jgi:cell division protease FtsH